MKYDEKMVAYRRAYRLGLTKPELPWPRGTIDALIGVYIISMIAAVVIVALTR